MRVFICSTCYDLIDLRAELESYFREAGITAVLSDSLSSEFQVMPDRNSIETCLANVRGCDELLILLSNRYGPSLVKAGYADISATHLEYREAISCKMPIRMYVRDRLEADFNIWRRNEKREKLELAWCKDPKDWKIFELLEEHRNLLEGKAQNNWLWSFRNSVELKQRIAMDFKEAFARATATKLFQNGRIPFIEVTGRIGQYDGQFVYVELHVRNLGAAVAVSPTLQLDGSSNRWDLQSLAAYEHTVVRTRWLYTGTVINLASAISYSILEGQRFTDYGNLGIQYVTREPERATVSYELKQRKYEGASSVMSLP